MLFEIFTVVTEDKPDGNTIEGDIKYSPHDESWPAIERRLFMSFVEVLEDYWLSANRRAGSKRITTKITSVMIL